MRNLELKARCPDEAALVALDRRALVGGASYMGTMGQRDTYFRSPHGRLKLRERWPAGEEAGATSSPAGPTAELISYSRPDAAGSRESDYATSPVVEPASLREALARALGVRVVVEKRRALYLLGRTRIHLDRVAGLGPFVELETVLVEGDEDALWEEHAHVKALLGLDALPPVAGSYADLLKSNE